MTAAAGVAADTSVAEAGRRPPRVVVGVDGSPGSRDALVYAFTAAARLGAELEVVSTFSLQLVWIGGYPLSMPAVATIRAETESRLGELVLEVRADSAVTAVPGTADVRTVLVVSVGAAAQRLVHASADADLLVVGSRGRGAVRSALLGSVGLHCVTHAPCPVVVVHPAPTGRPGRVLVGVDGSEGSRAALAAAVREAAWRGAEVDVVTSSGTTDHWADVSAGSISSVEVRLDLKRGAEAMVEDVLAEHRARSDGAAPRVRVVVAEGPAADVLVRWSSDAELLVVGSRGHGGFRGLLLGSVALACAMRGSGPVMVVHPAVEPGRRPGGGAGHR
ncbi:universal stress protein [Modestobacter marinus]|uniref:universal stress protein n=1 Tax=Modestobacter marinus TaxID=477641 RepID=UPI001C94C666|nr:universal stress protein [Modestobacter marinus]